MGKDKTLNFFDLNRFGDRQLDESNLRTNNLNFAKTLGLVLLSFFALILGYY